MNKVERWRHVEEVYYKVVDSQPEQRAAALNECCSIDLDLRREVELLLAARENAGDFLSSKKLFGQIAQLGLEKSSPAIGAKLGEYEILSVLGAGAMGEVYCARDARLGREVALKILPPHLADDAARVARFRSEARAASALNHPNVVTIYEIGQAGGIWYLAAELIKGVTLRERLRAGKLSLEESLQVVLQCAAALAAAHQAGIVHRDLKPENIMIRPDGVAKVVDFGLARMMETHAECGVNATQTGSVMGTPRYMSPEQAEGLKPDARSDVFSLGAVLFEMVSGRPAFPGQTTAQVFAAVLGSKPDAADTGPLRLFICRALEKDRTIRYQSMEEFADDLRRVDPKVSVLQRDPGQRPSPRQIEPELPAAEIVIGPHTVSCILSEEEVHQPPVEFPARTPLLVKKPRARISARMALVVGALVLVVLASTLFYERGRNTTPKSSFTSITTNDSENRVTAAAISSDGRLVAYGDSNGMWLRVLKGGATQQLASPPELHAERIAWFPDGLRLVVSGFHTTALRPEIWVIAITGQPHRLLRENARNGIPSPDGTQVAMTRNQDTEIWVEGAMGEEPRKISTGSEPGTFPFLLWSPDGKRLVYQRQRKAPLEPGTRRTQWDVSRQWRWDYESADVISGKVLASEPGVRFNSAGILASGQMFLLRRVGQYAAQSLWEVVTDPASGAFRSEPRMVQKLRVNTSGLTVSSDGARMATVVNSNRFDIFVADLVAGPRLEHARRLTLDLKAGYPHAWTIDSQAVIFESARPDQNHLYVQRIDQRTAEAISPTAMQEILPQSSPDGKWLLYATKKGNIMTLFRKPIAGGTAVRIAIDGTLDEFRCPPSGTHCVLRETAGNEQYHYYRLDPITGQGQELARTAWLPLMLGAWNVAPDGSAVAMPNHDPANRKIRIVPLAAGGVRPPEREIAVGVTGPLSSVAWAADGKGWFVSTQSDGEGTYSLWYVNLQGESHFLRETGVSTWPVPSPDGRELAFIDQTGDANVWLLQ